MNTFGHFNKTEYIRKSAVEEYLNFYNPKKNSIQRLYENLQKTPIFYVAAENNQILGMIRGRLDKIVNLFVDGKHHKKGIGRLLVNKFESEARKQKFKEIRIRASLYAVTFYQKMGYKKTTGIRNFHGLKIYPMKKIID
jgi:GNAT superfamily N-acetyltransferase